jgi:hypothetical protein
MGENPSLTQFLLLSHGPNGRRSNGYTISNEYIASPWRSSM